MDWFRWWHGTVTDPKFRSVVKRCGASLAEIIAVWAALLEHASNVTQCDAPVTSQVVTNVTVTRGDISGFCCEDFDTHFDFEEGKTLRIFRAFEEKGLIENGMISNWEKRQPKREDSSAARTREYRERKKSGKKQENNKNGDAPVTQCDAPVTHGDARLDKSRLDNNKDSKEPSSTLVEKKQKPQKTKKDGTPFPENFEVTDTLRAFADQRGYPSPDTELEKFREYHLIHASLSADWGMSMRTWLRKAYQFKLEREKNNAASSRYPNKNQNARHAGAGKSKTDILYAACAPGAFEGTIFESSRDPKVINEES